MTSNTGLEIVSFFPNLVSVIVRNYLLLGFNVEVHHLAMSYTVLCCETPVYILWGEISAFSFSVRESGIVCLSFGVLRW